MAVQENKGLTVATVRRSPLKRTSVTPSLINSMLKGENVTVAEFEPEAVVTVTELSPIWTSSKLKFGYCKKELN